MDAAQYEAVLKRYAAISEEIKQYTVQEGEHFIVMYTRILTDIPGFHRDLEQYEIYNARKSFAEIINIVTSRYKAFRDTGYAFECSFLQNLTHPHHQQRTQRQRRNSAVASDDVRISEKFKKQKYRNQLC